MTDSHHPTADAPLSQALNAMRWMAAIAVVLVLTRLLIRSEMVATPLRVFVLDVATALCTANVLVTLNHWKGTLPLIFRLRVHQFLAERSYSLYAIHTPLIMFACALLQSHFGMGWKMEQDDPRVWAVLAGVLMFVLLSTWAFAAVTEVQTAQIKRALRGMWPGARSALPSSSRPLADNPRATS